MSISVRSGFVVVLLLVLTVSIFSLSAASTHAQATTDQSFSKAVTGPANADQKTVVGIEFRGMVTFETGFMFADTEVGGLSGITFDPRRHVYYTLSDDRSEIDPARYYSLAIDLADGQIDDSDITFLDVTTLLDETGSPFAPGALDPEGIVLAREGFVFISSEGDANASPPIDPFVNRYNPNGRQTYALPVPDKFLPDGTGTSGIRNNLAFESLTVTPNRRYLYTATEGALFQDGPAADLDQESLSRVLQYDQRTKRPGQEFVYIVDPVAEVPDPPGAFRVNGLVELLAIDDAGTFLAMERSFSVGKGNTVKLYEILTQGATDVSGIDDLFDEDTGTPVEFDPVKKRLLLDFADLGLTPDNLEGLAFGPMLPDGHQSLIVVSDNNFNPGQVTQFIAFALELATVPDD